MNVRAMNPVFIRKIGLEALAKALGPLGMVRFLQQFESGVGDYTKEKDNWLKETDVKKIVAEIKSRRR